MPEQPSFYFTLFKKFQVVDHVPDGSVHGSVGGGGGGTGFDLTDPNSALGIFSANPGVLAPGDSNPADSPLWAVLNSRAMGNAAFSPVSITSGPRAGTSWPTMPPGTPQAWTDFQVTPASNRLLDVFGTWISNGQVNDVPVNAIATVPPAQNPGTLPQGVSLFVCSVAGDTGVRPGAVPNNYWATSLIYLVDQSNGATVFPTSLSSSEYNLVAVVGNRGSDQTGLYSSGSNTTGVESAGIVMVWNTTFSPGVELPALSNLDVTATNPIYQTYNIIGGGYDVVGFRLNVQNVFNGIIAALNQAVTNNQINLGGLTPEQWVTQSPAHLCAKVVIRQQGGAFPNVSDTPLTNAALAQKNLAPFPIGISDTDPNPTNIVWQTFVAGTPFFRQLPDGGLGRLRFVLRAAEDVIKLQLAVPTETFERYFRNGPGRLHGFQEIPSRKLCESPHGAKAKPFPEAVVFEHLGGEHVIEFPALPEKHFLAMAVGMEYQQRKLKPGRVGELDLVHRTEMPVVRPGTHSYDIEEQIVGGFTLQLQAVDVRPPARRH